MLPSVLVNLGPLVDDAQRAGAQARSEVKVAQASGDRHGNLTQPAGNGSSLYAAASLLDAPGGLTGREPAQKHDELFAADTNHSEYVADRLQMSQKLRKPG